MPRAVSTSVDLAIVSVHQLDAIAEGGEGVARDGQRVRIAIEADQAVGARVEERAAVAAETDRAVDEESATCRREDLDGFGHHDRLVLRLHRQIPNSASARASSSVYCSRCNLATNRS